MSESQRTILVKFNYIKTLGIIILTFYSNNWSKRSAVVIYNYVDISTVKTAGPKGQPLQTASYGKAYVQAFSKSWTFARG